MNLNAPMSAYASPSIHVFDYVVPRLPLSHVLMISTFLFSPLLSLYSPFPSCLFKFRFA
jgi:hypothetical protein